MRLPLRAVDAAIGVRIAAAIAGMDAEKAA